MPIEDYQMNNLCWDVILYDLHHGTKDTPLAERCKRVGITVADFEKWRKKPDPLAAACTTTYDEKEYTKKPSKQTEITRQIKDMAMKLINDNTLSIEFKRVCTNSHGHVSVIQFGNVAPYLTITTVWSFNAPTQIKLGDKLLYNDSKDKVVPQWLADIVLAARKRNKDIGNWLDWKIEAKHRHNIHNCTEITKGMAIYETRPYDLAPHEQEEWLMYGGSEEILRHNRRVR